MAREREERTGGKGKGGKKGGKKGERRREKGGEKRKERGKKEEGKKDSKKCKRYIINKKQSLIICGAKTHMFVLLMNFSVVQGF